MLRRGWTIGIVLLAGCGDEPLPPTELGEVCGEAGPVRVLELEPGRLLTESPVAHDGRVVLRTGTYPGEPGPVGPAWPEDIAVWSTGPCGESPVKLDAAVRDVVRAERWPELLLGYRVESRELVTLDVTGEGEGHVVFAGVAPSFPWIWNDHGLVTFEARGTDTGAALIHRFPDDPLAGTVTASELFAPVKILVDEDRVYAESMGQTAVLTDEMFVLQPDGALVSIGLADGAVTEEKVGVRSFAAAPDGRWLATQAPALPDALEGPVFLRDREGGGEIGLGDLRLLSSAQVFRFFAEGLMVIDVTGTTEGPQRVYTLATLDFVDLPPERRLAIVLADGRWVINSLFGEGIDLFDPKDRSVTPLVARGSLRAWEDEFVDVIDLPICCLDGASYTDEGALFRVSLTGEARELASRASRIGRRLTDGRWLTGLDLDDDFTGQLVLVDSETAESSRIDERVFVPSASMSSVFGDADALVYSVDDGARSGVWVARLGGD